MRLYNAMAWCRCVSGVGNKKSFEAETLFNAGFHFTTINNINYNNELFP